MPVAGSARARRGAIALLLALSLAIGFFATRWLVLRGGGDAVATLKAKVGDADRDFRQTVGSWKPVELHAQLFVGDGVRTGKASSATLTLADRSELSLEARTIIRFLDRPTSAHTQHLDLQMGEAVLQVGGEPLSLDTEIGAAVLRPGSRISLRRSDTKTRYEVLVGMARFETKDGQATDVAAGEGVEIGIGTAKLERYDVKPAASPSPAASAPQAREAPVAPTTGDISALVVGSGASVRAPGETKFARLPAGEGRVRAGSTLRLSSGTTADVARGGQRVTLRGAGDFVVAEPGKPFIITQGGGVALTGAESEVEIAVPGGSIVTRLGARGEALVRKDATHVSVTAGTVELRGVGGVEQLTAGEEGTIGEKGAEVASRGPGYVDLVVPAGASFAVHDPRPPTAIGFATGAICPEGASVQLTGATRTRSQGSGTVTVLVPAGAHRYVVRCLGGGTADPGSSGGGAVAVLHDGGTARIPRTAPATVVDTDGRSYTVLYQNLLPKITVRWPSPPAAPSYTLRIVSPGGKSETMGGATAAHSFPSGALREGEHRVSFDASGVRSKETKIDIKFDNAAPTATLVSPSDGGFAPGAAVTVSGLALEGWKISVGGKDLPLDGQLRFSGEATAPTGQRALAIEFVHPRRGVHYYLRRASP